MANFYASDKDSNTMKKKRFRKNKEREENGKKCRKNSSLYCSLHGKNNSHTSREYKVLKERDAEKYKSKYGKKYYNKKFKELNILQSEAAHQKSKYIFHQEEDF